MLAAIETQSGFLENPYRTVPVYAPGEPDDPRETYLESVPDTRLRGAVVGEGTRFKTGTLKDSTGLAGYLRTAAGETRIVVAIINHENAKKGVARPLVDALVEWAATLN